MPNDVFKCKAIQDSRSHPDTFILQPAGKWRGLGLEFKESRDKIYRKNGKYRQNKHLQAQIKCMNDLIKRGYQAGFVWEFEQGVRLIDEYLMHGD